MKTRAQHDGKKTRQQKRGEKHNRRIDHQPFEPRPDDLAPLVVVGQQGQDGREIVGPLRSELLKLGDDLSKGTPLREALQARQLPDLYRQMLEVGAQANDLPAVLTLLADHYQRRQVIWTRLKGLMVYPAIVFFAALLLSCFFPSC